VDGGLRLSQPGRAWAAFAAALAAGALLGLLVPPAAWDWQPARAGEAWRWWTAAFVHFSDRHLAINLAGVLVVGALGFAGRVPRRAALAWALAWPMTHGLLLLRPEIAHYGGLSGVLHAGVGAAATWVALAGRARALAFAILGGLAAKVVLETPWGDALVPSATLGIAVAPLVHATGAVAGTLTALAMYRGPAHARRSADE